MGEALGTGAEQVWATLYAQQRRSSTPMSRSGARALARGVFLSVAGTLKRPRDTSHRFMFLHDVYDDQRDHFRTVLSRMAELGTFISMGHSLDIVAGRKKATGPTFSLSFDDGFDNNYRNAFPILQDLQIPATFFVTSALVGATDAELLPAWRQTSDNPLPTRTMTWTQLEEISGAGHEIGSHTRRHLRLSAISGDSARLHDEVAGSKAEIEDRLGKACRYLAWPFGGADDFDDRARNAVVDAGYEACFSAIRGRAEPARADVFALPRHDIEMHWPWPHIRFFALGGGETSLSEEIA